VLWFEAWCSSSRCLLDSSSSSGDVLLLLEDYISGLTRYERSGQNSEDHRRDPYHEMMKTVCPLFHDAPSDPMDLINLPIT
jgi:hypothetical protein